MTALQWVVDQYGKRQENKGHANHACDAMMYLRNAAAKLLPSAAVEPAAALPARASRVVDDPDDPIVHPEPAPMDADSMYANEW